MSSFLCFVCHSTVNADTNEETRDKYREVIGMHLCPDSHLCFICCYFLNKMCMFKSICLKRSLEYPVLFSEKGTINLQRSDIQVAISCPEDICLQHLNTKYHFYNNNENSQSDYGDNNYCQLQDENIKTTDFNKDYFSGDVQEHKDYFNENGQEHLKNKDYLFTENVEEHLRNKDYLFSDNVQEHLKNNNFLGDNVQEHLRQKDYFSGENVQEHLKHKDYFSVENVQIHLKQKDYLGGNIQEHSKPENDTYHDNNFIFCKDKQEMCVDFQNDYFSTENNDIFNEEIRMIEPVKFTENDGKAKKDAVLLELNSKIEVVIDLPLNEIINHEDNNEIIENNKEENNEVESQDYDSDNTIYNFIYNSDTETQNSGNNEEIVEDQEIKIDKKKKDFQKIKLSVKEQKKELEEARREEKYVSASYKCFNCALSFHFKDSYQAHMMRHEESNGEYSCVICSLRFANPAVLRSHARNHTERYKCTQCDAIVRARQRITHMRACTGSQVDCNTVYCHLCNAGFIGQSHLQQHIKRYHQAKNSNRTYLCNICGKSYNNQAAVRTHMITHINRKFSCDLCTSTFSSPYTLNQHKKKHNSTEQELHYCMQCKIGYNTRKSLLAHMRNALAHKDSVYKCPVCPRTCPSIKSLQAHTDALHARTNHLSCEICPAKYSTRKALVRHMRSHKGIGPKITPLCHACGENFKSTSALKRHLKNVCEKDKIEEIFFQ